MQSDDGLLVVLGGRGTDVDERLLRVQMQVVRFHQFEFLAAKAGMHRCQINYLVRSSRGQQTGNFVACERPVAGVLAFR